MGTTLEDACLPTQGMYTAPYTAVNPSAAEFSAEGEEGVYRLERRWAENLAVPRKSYGRLIREAREAARKDHAWVAERVGRSVSTVRRWEDGEDKPSIDSINTLVSILPLSAEELVLAMGLNLNPPPIARLPRALVDALVRLGPADQRQVLRIARGLAALPDEPQEPPS